MTEQSKAKSLIEEARELLAAPYRTLMPRDERRILSALCDELDQQVSLNKTQSENISTLQSQQRVMKEAIDLGVVALEWAIAELSKHGLAGASYAPVLQKARVAIKALRSSTTPKGEQS